MSCCDQKVSSSTVQTSDPELECLSAVREQFDYVAANTIPVIVALMSNPSDTVKNVARLPFGIYPTQVPGGTSLFALLNDRVLVPFECVTGMMNNSIELSKCMRETFKIQEHEEVTLRFVGVSKEKQQSLPSLESAVLEISSTQDKRDCFPKFKYLEWIMQYIVQKSSSHVFIRPGMRLLLQVSDMCFEVLVTKTEPCQPGVGCLLRWKDGNKLRLVAGKNVVFKLDPLEEYR